MRDLNCQITKVPFMNCHAPGFSFFSFQPTHPTTLTLVEILSRHQVHKPPPGPSSPRSPIEPNQEKGGRRERKDVEREEVTPPFHCFVAFPYQRRPHTDATPLSRTTAAVRDRQRCEPPSRHSFHLRNWLCAGGRKEAASFCVFRLKREGGGLSLHER